MIVRQEHTECDSVHTYDTDTGTETHEYIEHVVCVDGPVETMASDSSDDDEDKEDDCECNAEVNEEKEVAEDCKEDDEKDEECNAALAEANDVPDGEWQNVIAELKESLQNIQSELAALKEHYIKTEVIAEAEASEEERTDAYTLI